MKKELNRFTKAKGTIIGSLLVGFFFLIGRGFAVDVGEIPTKVAGMGLSLVEINSIIGTIRGIFNDNGKIGIGTSSPLAKLEINGNIIADEPIEGNHVVTKDYVDASLGNSYYGGKMLSARSTLTYASIKDASLYCWNLNAPADIVLDNNLDSLTGPFTEFYTDWRIPSLKELIPFTGLDTSSSYLWTSTLSGWGSWSSYKLWEGVLKKPNTDYVRCIR